MCTIVVLHQAHPDRDLIVAANRDELRDRPARPPGPVPGARVPTVAGVDERGGGTWIGANRRGFFVGLTNQRSHAPPDRRLRSRGMLALEALRIGDHDAVRDWLESDAVDTRQMNDFNLFFGQPGRLSVGYGRRDDASWPLCVEPLEPGLHVLANDRLRSPEFPRASRAEALVRDVVDLPWGPLRKRLEAVLADTDEPPLEAVPPPPPGSRFDRTFLQKLQAICIRTPAYGTVSATVLAADGARGLTDYRYADGPPCAVPFADVPLPS